jgi:hypothetical protein
MTLIDEDFDHLAAERHLLAMQAAALCIDKDVWGAADRTVAAEILDICLRRFRRMPQEALRNNAALLNVLRHLQSDEEAHANEAALARAA